MSHLTEQAFSHLLKSQCIALTGGVATGKSTVAAFLRDLGKTVIDADQMARDVVKPGTSTLHEIIKIFGVEVIARDGHLDRKKLRDIVMNDETKRSQLEAIIHPAIHKMFKRIVENLHLDVSGKTFFYEAALIFETGRNHLFKEVWSTTCPSDVQVARLSSRSGLTQAESLKIIAAQMPAFEKARKANLAIDTDCPMDELRQQIEDLVKTRGI